MKKTNILLLIGVLVITLLTGCAQSHAQVTLPANEHIYGFWAGTWHGIIMLPAFFGSLVWNDIVIYAVNNNGHWYDFGFVGGFFMFTRFIARLLKS